MNITNLSELDKLKEDDIYLLIGKEILQNEQHFVNLTSNQIIEKAKVWFKLNLPKFRDIICSNTTIREVYDQQDIGNLSSAIIDLIAGSLTGIAPVTVAYLIYRQGLNAICKNHWK